MQFGTSKAKIKHGKISRRLRSFFKGGRSVPAAQPMDVHDVQPQNESQLVDEHDRSTKLEDLNLKDWPLEDSFKPVSNFLNPMPSNPQGTELERRDISLFGTNHASQGETASASVSTNAVDKCRKSGTPQKCRYQYFRRRRIRTIDTADKRHGGGPNTFGHHNHVYCRHFA